MADVLTASEAIAFLSDPDAGAACISNPLVAVDSGSLAELSDSRAGELSALLSALPFVSVAVRDTPSSRFVDVADRAAMFTSVVAADDLAAVEHRVRAAPGAALTLDSVLRLVESLPASAGVAAEAHAYSMLLAGGAFDAWRRSQPRKDVARRGSDLVALERRGAVFTVTLDDPATRNAFDRAMRDQLCAALDVALIDPTVERVVVRGTDPSFCSGGALWEFGDAKDVVQAAAVRLARNVGLRIDRLRDRGLVVVQGACVGAGIEIAAFARTVIARPDAWARLPELEMGLIPGAGGTVSVSRRVGRQRTAWLVLTGARLDAATMLEWGLVDRVVDQWSIDELGRDG